MVEWNGAHRSAEGKKDLAMPSAAYVLHGEVCNTLSLTQIRGEFVREQAWDVLHENLEACGGLDFENACELLLKIRYEKKNGFYNLYTFGTELH